MGLPCAAFIWYDDPMFKDLPEGQGDIVCRNGECDGHGIRKVQGGHVHGSDSTGYLSIDPCDQLFMDFFASVHEKNADGITNMIRYNEWGAKVREMIGAERDKIRADLIGVADGGEFEDMRREVESYFGK